MGCWWVFVRFPEHPCQPVYASIVIQPGFEDARDRRDVVLVYATQNLVADQHLVRDFDVLDQDSVPDLLTKLQGSFLVDDRHAVVLHVDQRSHGDLVIEAQTLRVEETIGGYDDPHRFLTELMELSSDVVVRVGSGGILCISIDDSAHALTPVMSGYAKLSGSQRISRYGPYPH